MCWVTRQKGMKVEDGIQVSNQLSLKTGNAGVPSGITRVLKHGRGKQERVRERGVAMGAESERCCVSGFDDGRGP